MKIKAPQGFVLFALLLLGALTVVILIQSGGKVPSQEIDGKNPSASALQESAPAHHRPVSRSTESAPATKGLDFAARELAPFLASPVSLQDGGAQREFRLSTSELSIRDHNGERRVVALSPADSDGNFSAAIEKIRSEYGNEPELVIYPVGLPRNEFTRRIVTRELIVSADSRAEFDPIARAEGLEFKQAPAFAPEFLIYEAPTSLSALAFLAGRSPSLEARPLLASLSAKKAMPNDPFIHLQWHLKYQGSLGSLAGTDINVEDVWNYPSMRAFSSSSANNTNSYIRGNEVVIGIVDDGMEWNHPDLRSNALRNLQRDWNGRDYDPKPFSFHGHGTACGGVAAARGNNRIGVSGVAPEANLAGLRLIAGSSTDLDEAEAMTWFVNPETFTDTNGNGRWDSTEPLNDLNKNRIWDNSAIHILSNSWGPVDDGFTLESPGALTAAALKYATDFGRNGRGTIFTWAAGNGQRSEDNSNYDGYANSIYTIAIGAVDSLGGQSYYSEPGSNIVVAAPSNGASPALGIMTSDNKGLYGYNPGFGSGNFPGSGDVTRNFGGTSSACPVVSGVVALMLQRNPRLGWRDVQEILIRSAAQVDANDPEWITSNRTDHVSSNKTVEFHFNEKYGAGLVDAAAAVALSGSWTNLKPQMSRTVARTVTRRINPAPSSPVDQTFSVGAPNFRTEHVTLELNITDIPKGDLTVTLTSPQNTVSTFCLPHRDNINTLTNWRFMTVRNWGEEASGIWQLSITNNGTLAGNLTRAELVVYGAELPADAPPANPAPSVTLVPSATRAAISSNLTLNATAVALSSNGSVSGNITGVQFFLTSNGSGNATLIGNGTLANNSTLNPATYTLSWNTSNLTAGSHSITAVARTSANVTGASPAVTILLENELVAGWDFQTLTSNKSSVPLTTALYGTRAYRSNFGTGNATLFMNGTNGSSRWNVSAGEIFVGDGSNFNLGAGFSSVTSNPAGLLLRGGRNLSANNKILAFQIDLTKSSRLVISYAVQGSATGFTTHVWEFFDTTAQIWRPFSTRTISNTKYSVETLPRVVANTGFYGNANARVRLTVSGATGIEGTNLLDNITFTATRLP